MLDEETSGWLVIGIDSDSLGAESEVDVWIGGEIACCNSETITGYSGWTEGVELLLSGLAELRWSLLLLVNVCIIGRVECV